MILQTINSDSYFINFYAFPMFVVAVAITLLGFFILARERGSRIGIYFLFMCLCVGLYLFGTGACYASRDESLSLLWLKISHLGTVFIPTTILLLTTKLLNRTHPYRFTIASSFVLIVPFCCRSFFH